jgi:uncharacterized protein YkwD
MQREREGVDISGMAGVKGARRALAALVLLACLAAPQPFTPSAPAAIVGDCVPASDWGTLRSDYASKVVDLVNQHRISKGLPALKVSPTLANAAVWKGRHMAEYRYMTHNDPAPPVARTAADRIETCGYRWGWGENIAYGYSTPEAVVQAWLNSAGHRANIENASFTVIGVGAAAADGGTLYWAQVFGTYDDSGVATPSPAPAPTTATAFPSSTTIQNGSLRAGDAARLKADDDSYFQVNSSSTYRRASWYGRFTGVPNSVRTLKATYKGKNSAGCSQTVALRNYRTGSWTIFDSRTSGTSEVEISLTPTGTLADYVSGTSGNGDLLLRVRCSRSDSTSFYSSGDLMKLVYETA